MKWRLFSKRKLAYIISIVVLLVPLSVLSQPSTVDSTGKRTTGGHLAELRERHHLSQANLGEIDPASETIKLATLGMRGVAANVLWQKANEFQKKEDWTSLSATLEQLTRLQPNVISFWHFQAWNLSYNVSVAFDNYKDRYQWVIRGIDFLKKGTQYNVGEPSLLWDIGWFTSQKIGRADEQKLYRQLFKQDYGRDNWLVGKDAFIAAQTAVENSRRAIQGVTRTGEKKGGMNPLLFNSDAPKCQINYSEALEEDGTFGQIARGEWNKAYDEWLAYGAKDIPTGPPFDLSIRLNDLERFQERAKEARAELETLLPEGLEEQIRGEILSSLSDAERDAHQTASADRTDSQKALAAQVDEKLVISPFQLANRVEGANRAKALAAAEAISQSEMMQQVIEIQRDIVNFAYWRERCEFERTEEAVSARQNIYEADRAMADSDFALAGQKYEQGLKDWRAVLDQFPNLLQQSLVIEDLQEMIGRYQEFLGHVDRELPGDFILRDVLEVEMPGQTVRMPASSSAAPSTEQPATDAPAEQPAGEQPASEPSETDEPAAEQPSTETAPQAASSESEPASE